MIFVLGSHQKLLQCFFFQKINFKILKSSEIHDLLHCAVSLALTLKAVYVTMYVLV